MVVANKEIDETKNAGKLTTISMAMAMQRYDAGRITRWSLAGNVVFSDVIEGFDDMVSCLPDTSARHGRRVGDIM